MSQLVTLLNVPCLIYIWNELFISNSFEIIDKAIIAAIKINTSGILQNFLDSTKYNKLIYINTQLPNLKKEIDQIQIDSKEVFELKQKYYKDWAKIWNKAKKCSLQQLEKTTNLTMEEILEL